MANSNKGRSMEDRALRKRVPRRRCWWYCEGGRRSAPPEEGLSLIILRYDESTAPRPLLLIHAGAHWANVDNKSSRPMLSLDRVNAHHKHRWSSCRRHRQGRRKMTSRRNDFLWRKPPSAHRESTVNCQPPCLPGAPNLHNVAWQSLI